MYSNDKAMDPELSWELQGLNFTEMVVSSVSTLTFCQ